MINIPLNRIDWQAFIILADLKLMLMFKLSHLAFKNGKVCSILVKTKIFVALVFRNYLS